MLAASEAAAAALDAPALLALVLADPEAGEVELLQAERPASAAALPVTVPSFTKLRLVIIFVPQSDYSVESSCSARERTIARTHMPGVSTPTSFMAASCFSVWNTYG